jgi:hypothetical protein
MEKKSCKIVNNTMKKKMLKYTLDDKYFSIQYMILILCI